MYQNWTLFFILLIIAILIFAFSKDIPGKKVLAFSFLIFFMVWFLLLVAWSTYYYGDLLPGQVSTSYNCPQNDNCNNNGNNSNNCNNNNNCNTDYCDDDCY